jgi:hypothetical protein
MKIPITELIPSLKTLLPLFPSILLPGIVKMQIDLHQQLNRTGVGNGRPCTLYPVPCTLYPLPCPLYFLSTGGIL